MNGWCNHETWSAVNWGFNDFPVEDFSSILENEDIDELDKIYAIAEIMEANFISYTDDLFPKLISGSNFVSELFTTAANKVDWVEIARSWYEGNKS